MARKLNESLTFLAKTGSKQDGQQALSTLSLIRIDQRIWGRAGKTSPHAWMGVVGRIDYSSQSATIGNLQWGSIDSGEDIQIGGKLRAATSEEERVERNLFVATHLAAAYECVLQGVPGGPGIHLACKHWGPNIRQHEYQADVLRAQQLQTPSTQRANFRGSRRVVSAARPGIWRHSTVRHCAD